jgi:predicted glutamine amidotransferase
MLIAIGQFPISKLLNAFKLVAMNRNEKEKHELNKGNRNFIHGDGWGIVIGKSGKIEEFYKKDIACWKDPKFLEYYNANTDFVILHARRASPGSPINCSYTHPFEKEGWYFCHNGTITDTLAKDKRDSEHFFTLLLSNLRKRGNVINGIKDSVNHIKEYTALNFILANNNKAYILVKYQQYPNYYTMKYLRSENFVIASSEILPNFDGEWVNIENNYIVMIDVSTRQIEETKLT